MSTPSVVVFDVNETLSDLRPLAQVFDEVGASAELMPLWFASVLREGFALTAAGSTARFSDIGREVLLDLLPPTVADPQRAAETVLARFSALPLHTDVVPAVQALRAAGLRLVTMSNGSASVAEALLGSAGVRDAFELLLSVDDAGAWKPDRAAYDYARSRCGVPVEDLVMVAVHPWDLDGAARAGLRTAWVNRSGRRYPSYALPPTYTLAGLHELPAALR